MVWEKSEVTNFLTKLRTKHRTHFCPGVGWTHVTWYISSWGIDWYRSHYVIVFGLRKRRPQYPRGDPEVPPRTSVGTSQVRPGKSGYIQMYGENEYAVDFMWKPFPFFLDPENHQKPPFFVRIMTQHVTARRYTHFDFIFLFYALDYPYAQCLIRNPRPV